MKEYKAVVWPSDDESVPGQRVTYVAKGSQQAAEALRAELGENVHYFDGRA